MVALMLHLECEDGTDDQKTGQETEKELLVQHCSIMIKLLNLNSAPTNIQNNTIKFNL